nr:hypothetical protein [Ruminococcus bromii]
MKISLILAGAVSKMSKIPLDEMTFETEFPSNVYSVEIYSELSPADFEQLFQKFRYHCKKQRCSFLICFSHTDSRTAKQQKIKSCKRGRPRHIVTGTTVPGHAHTAVLKADGSARQCCLSLKKSLDKGAGKPISKIVSKGSGIHAQNYIQYSIRQADCIRQGGDFSFIEFCKQNLF